ncbi:MAG TPA: response regulator transcription factor [Granulicella sp.]|jgi:DNA-binding response OmpR family regulator|nr:response regulator transcription factor [Granulicella sp.]
MHVLVIEDEPALSLILKYHLELEGHQVEVAADGATGLTKAAEAGYDMVLLDLNLPGCDGTEILRALRAADASTPTIVLSARAGLEDRLRCFDLGADDYLAKPFALRELSMRIKAISRRAQALPEPVLRCADLELNRVQRSVMRGGRRIDLSAREYALVEYLIQHKGRCVPRTTLLRHVWNMPEQSGTNVVEVYVNYLRRKVDQGFGRPLIHTVRGEGYVIRELNTTLSTEPGSSPVAGVPWRGNAAGAIFASPSECIA